MSKIVESMPVQEVRFKDLKLLNKQTLCIIMKSLNLEVDQSLIKANLVAQLQQRFALLSLEEGDAGNGGGGAAGGAAGGGAGGGEAGGEGDGNDDDGSDDDGSDDDGSDGPYRGCDEELEEMIQIYVRMINVGSETSRFRTFPMMVSRDDTIWTLKTMIRQMLDIPRGVQSLFHHGLCENAELLEEGCIYTLRTNINGGGKRAAGGGAKTLGKDAEMMTLQGSVNMMVMRLQANLNASPLFAKINATIHKQNELGDELNIENLEALLAERGMTEKGLDKLLTITTVSTRKEERCRHIASIIFASEMILINELSSLTETAKNALQSNVQLVISRMFMDNTGLIAWEKFVEKIGAIIKKVSAANLPPVSATAPME